MEFEAWEPKYDAIRARLGIDRVDDETARDILCEYLDTIALDRLDLSGDRVAVVVGAALTSQAYPRLRGMDAIIATADALNALERAAIPVRVVVTDLDTDPARVCARTRKRGFVAVHGHGDNRRLLTRWIPRMGASHTIGTTQAAPLTNVYNFGGFTDGDRAAFMADALGAETIEFIGWDLDASTVSPRKRTKLEIARELLGLLEQRRDTRFSDLQLSGNASSSA